MALVGSCRQSADAAGWPGRWRSSPSGTRPRSADGEAAHGIFVIFNADAVQQLDGPALAPAQPLLPAALVGPAGDTLNQLLADALRGSKARLGLLKIIGHVMADQLPALAVRQSQQVDVIEAHAVGRDPPVVLVTPQIALAKAFPGAGLPTRPRISPSVSVRLTRSTALPSPRWF